MVLYKIRIFSWITASSKLRNNYSWKWWGFLAYICLTKSYFGSFKQNILNRNLIWSIFVAETFPRKYVNGGGFNAENHTNNQTNKSVNLFLPQFLQNLTLLQVVDGKIWYFIA